MEVALSRERSQETPIPFTLTQVGVLVVAAYIAAQILSDVGSLKIAWIAGFSIDGGTFIYPLTFTLRDMVHKQLGRKVARTIILAAGAINLLMAGYFALLALLPADPSWPLQESFAAVLAPAWRIVVASIAAELVSELLDTELYHLWVTRITRRFQWARVLTSNSISIPIDSLIFCWGAFGGTIAAATVWSIFWANVLVKGITTLISLPGIYLVPENKVTED